MAKTVKKQETTVVTRAEKKDATKNIIRELLAVKPHKHNELIDEVAKIYAERFGGEDTENVNDVKGRVGSVLDIMKKDSDVAYEGGMYALKARLPMPTEEEKPVKKTTRAKAKKVVEETVEEVKTEEKPKRKTTKKAEKKPAQPKPAEEEEVILPMPPAPIQPIAPVAPITPEVAPEPIPPQEEPAPKKRGRKAKAKAEEVKTEEPPVVAAEEKPEEKQAEPEAPVAVEVKYPPVTQEKAEVAKKNVVMDMSFLFGDTKPAKAEVKAEKPAVETAKEEPKKEEKAALPVKTEKKTEQKTERKTEKASAPVAKLAPVVKKETRVIKAVRKAATKPLTADEKLCEAFLKRMRALGGDYFEYYSVYLLERYSMKNGRRLEGLKICGGDHDGGIDGEIELTDKFGFKETIYIQSKNWDPEKGDERLWVVGETLLQQFIGACACKQAKDGKQHCRGIFITTSRFTPDAKRILEDMSDKIIGYDGVDLYEAAKECSFGVIKKNGEWALDDKLLSGTKAFFNMM